MQIKRLATVAAAAPLAAAQSSWDEAYTSAESALSGLSLEDKVGIVTGVGWQEATCVGNTSGAESIGYPGLCVQDGPLGVRYANSITAFTPGIQAAATWDVDLIRQRGQYLGEEFRGSGVHNFLGPVAGALGKVAEGGRNWEGFGVDPYLTGVCMAETIVAMQAVGVQTTAKHWIVNEQELNRETMSSNVDDRAMHELYVWPFADAVHAGVTAVMCSYNKVHGDWSCENEYVLNTLLKEQLGFPGYVMTDWGAHHSTVQSAVNGLDMSMPGTNYNGDERFWAQNLIDAVNNGEVPQDRVDDMVKRILAAHYLVGQDSGDYPAFNLNADVQANHKENVRAVARDGIVLLKNDDSALPLTTPASIAVIGSGATTGDHTSNNCQDKACNDGALGMGWGSGSVEYPYFVTPLDAIKERAGESGATVTASESDEAGAGASAAQGADVAFVFITADSGEGYLEVEGNQGDRNDLNPWHNGNELVEAVAGANDNVVVVVHSVGPVILESVLSHASVKAVVWAGLPSQESGNALVDILWGDSNPSGKLVYTIAQSADDYNTQVINGDDPFTEGIYIDYRHFDNAGIEPRYEFGYGLSYTTFEYADITVDASVTSGPATGDTIPGGPADLWEDIATVSVTISNTGDVDGAEVAQLYLAYPDSVETPPLQLRGFDKVSVAAGASETATFNIRRRDVSFWDVDALQWIVPSGTFGVNVGSSSRDIRAEGSFDVS